MDLDANIIKHAFYIQHAISKTQEKWKSISSDPVVQSYMESQASNLNEAKKEDNVTITFDFKGKTDFGKCTLHTHHSQMLSVMSNIGNNTVEMTMDLGTSNPFLLASATSMARKRCLLYNLILLGIVTKNETFPFPPLTLSLHHVFTPSVDSKRSESKEETLKNPRFKTYASETNMMVAVEASHIKFSPTLIVYIEELLERFKVLLKENPPSIKPLPEVTQKQKPKEIPKEGEEKRQPYRTFTVCSISYIYSGWIPHIVHPH
jgi:hypothetical protein